MLGHTVAQYMPDYYEINSECLEAIKPRVTLGVI